VLLFVKLENTIVRLKIPGISDCSVRRVILTLFY